MSIDLYLQIDTGGKHLATVVEVGNYTNNCQPMWTKALNASPLPNDINLAYMNSYGELKLCYMTGMEASYAVPILTMAVAHMDDPANEADYIALNPPNGWGEFKSAREYLRSLLDACREHPKSTIYASC